MVRVTGDRCCSACDLSDSDVKLEIAMGAAQCI